jgi:hypothetical protein
LKVALVALFLLLTGSLSNSAEIDGRRFTIGQMTADLDILHDALISGDPGVYRHVQRAALQSEFLSVRARLNRPMDAVEFFRVVAPAVAAIKDGHAHFDWPSGFRAQFLTSEEVLPLGVRVLQDDRAFIFRDFSSTAHDLAGSELLSINERSARSLLFGISRTLAEDADIPTSRRVDSSGRNFVEDLPLVLGVSSPFVITVEKNGKRRTLTLAGERESSLIGDWKHLYGGDVEVGSQSAADFRMLPHSSIAVMRVSSWDDSDATNLRGHFAEWFRQMQSARTATLIIDIRHNGGGEDTLGTLLYSYLASGRFLYYKDALANGVTFDFLKYVEGHDEKDALPQYVAPMKAASNAERELPGEPTARFELIHRPNLGLQEPSRPHFGGRVIVLIDGQSFSTSAEFAAIAHSSHRATFVGEESSGSYYGNDSGITPTVVLPNTKFRIDVPLIAYYTAVSGHRYLNRGVMPDCPISTTIEDDLNGEDKAMGAALALAAGKHLDSCSRIDY